MLEFVCFFVGEVEELEESVMITYFSPFDNQASVSYDK